MTLEEAQAEIIRLNEELTARTNERDAHSTTIATLTSENENLRHLNQQYFNKLSAQYIPQENGGKNDGDDAPISCEEYAKNLNII